MSKFDSTQSGSGSADPRWGTRRPGAGPVVDITLDGRFAEAPQPGIPPIPARIMGYAILVAILGGGLAIGLLALWLALTIIPIVIGAGLIAYVVFRAQRWFARQGSFGGKRDVFRP
jgi:hypothetical protein